MAYYDCPWSLYVKMRFLEFWYTWVIEFIGFVSDIVISGVQAKWCTYFLWTLGKFHQWVGKWEKVIETPVIWTIANLTDSYSCNHRNQRKEEEKSLFMTRRVRLLSAKLGRLINYPAENVINFWLFTVSLFLPSFFHFFFNEGQPKKGKAKVSDLGRSY